jgi:hypothetical protein
MCKGYFVGPIAQRQPPIPSAGRMGRFTCLPECAGMSLERLRYTAAYDLFVKQG